MSQESSTFENYPIEFKEINPEDFTEVVDSDGVIEDRGAFIVENDGSKIIIEPNTDTGFINEVLQPHIDIHHKNTVVINAAVGQGKSYSIIQTIKRYLEDDSGQEYLIMVAAPYKSLVKQYGIDINSQGSVPLNQIYTYDNIGNEDISYLDKKVHIITVNTLLGNPGGNFFRNSEDKRNYLNTLSAHCKENDIKVVFVYDEIHASYYNFEEKYIFNLWKWKDVIHKNFIISATYNEASKVIIEYLAELTSRKIKIIESKRTRITDKQSSLHLHFTPTVSVKSDNPQLVSLIDDSLEKGKNIDILCFSKKLSKEIIGSEIGSRLTQKFGEINLCVSKSNNQNYGNNAPPRNQFENTKCNIGTNFSTGVSIQKENHVFIIILPSRNTKGKYKNEYGIFTDGLNSIIQAIARQRKKGEIHVLLYNPDKFDYSSLRYANMTSNQRENFEQQYSSLEYYKVPCFLVEYKSVNFQNTLLKYFYNNLRADFQEEILSVESSDRTNLPPLSYPSFSRFQLEQSSKYLASKFSIFGKDISACLTYMALTNQFINCKLVSISIKPDIDLTLSSIQSCLDSFYKVYINPHDHEYYLTAKNNGNFSLFYNEIRSFLFNSFRPRVRINETADWNNIQPYGAKRFEVRLIEFCYNIYYYSKYNEGANLSRGEYFLNSIKIVNTININTIPNIEINRVFRNKVRLYQLLNEFRLKVLDKVETHTIRSREIKFLPNSPNNELINIESKAMIEELETLTESDVLLSNDVFKFRRNIVEKSNSEQKIKSLYTIILKDFFESTSYRLTSGNRPNGVKISAIKELPEENLLDLISPPLSYEIATDQEILEGFDSIEAYENNRDEIMEMLRDI